MKLVSLRALSAAFILMYAGILTNSQDRSRRPPPILTSEDLIRDVGGPTAPLTTTRDGVSSVTVGNVFKEGPTEVTPIDFSALKQAPPLPTGYRVYKNLAYRIDTEAIVSGPHTVVFSIQSAADPAEFNSLRILHLTFDESSPTKSSWEDRTVPHSKARDVRSGQSAPRGDNLSPDFAAKTISAQVNRMGIFVITSQDQSRPPVDRPFTDMEVSAAGGHGAVSPGGDITYTITVRNRGPKAAGEVTLHAELSPDLDFISASPSRGTCHKSELSDGTILCSLAAIPEGTGVNVTVVARVRRNEFLDKAERKIPFLVFVRFKERPADMQSYVNMVESRIDTTIAPQRKITHHR